MKKFVLVVVSIFLSTHLSYGEDATKDIKQKATIKQKILNIITQKKEICLTEEEFQATIDRLLKDEKIIETEKKRWEKVRQAIPQIKYSVEQDVVIQELTLPIEGETPLEFKNKFKVEKVGTKYSYCPLAFKLLGGYETTNGVDIKLGLEVLSLKPLTTKWLGWIKPLSLNLLVGIKSSGASVSYYLPKPLSNTALHFYYGIAYKKDFTQVIGGGISLNF